MSRTESGKKAETYAVIDTNVFVPAVACHEPEARFYAQAILNCWKIVVSQQSIEEYGRVIHYYGYRADVILHELNKLDAINKYRCSRADLATVQDDLAPHKDHHIVAPCKEHQANVIVTQDGGLLDKKAKIADQTGARVMNVTEAQNALDAL